MEKRIEDNPAAARFPNPVNQHPDAIPYSEEIFVGYRGYEKNQVQPLFPFGFGLSYTSFAFSDLKIAPAKFTGSDEVSVTFTVTNTREAGRSRGSPTVCGPAESHDSSTDQRAEGFPESIPQARPFSKGNAQIESALFCLF
jgi:beta-glucosidase